MICNAFKHVSWNPVLLPHKKSLPLDLLGKAHQLSWFQKIFGDKMHLRKSDQTYLRHRERVQSLLMNGLATVD